MSAPAAWAVVLKHAPMFKFVVGTSQLKPYVTNMRVSSFVSLGMIGQKDVDAIDQDLRQLPRSEWPAQ